MPAADRARLEQQDQLPHISDDHILLMLKSPWADGTRYLMFARMGLLEKLAALTPPAHQLILYHGVLAPHARWRARVVAYGAHPRSAAPAPHLEGDSNDDAPAPAYHWASANLMRRT